MRWVYRANVRRKNVRQSEIKSSCHAAKKPNRRSNEAIRMTSQKCLSSSSDPHHRTPSTVVDSLGLGLCNRNGVLGCLTIIWLARDASIVNYSLDIIIIRAGLTRSLSGTGTTAKLGASLERRWNRIWYELRFKKVVETFTGWSFAVYVRSLSCRLLFLPQ